MLAGVEGVPMYAAFDSARSPPNLKARINVKLLGLRLTKPPVVDRFNESNFNMFYKEGEKWP